MNTISNLIIVSLLALILRVEVQPVEVLAHVCHGDDDAGGPVVGLGGVGRGGEAQVGEYRGKAAVGALFNILTY